MEAGRRVGRWVWQREVGFGSAVSVAEISGGRDGLDGMVAASCWLLRGPLLAGAGRAAGRVLAVWGCGARARGAAWQQSRGRGYGQRGEAWTGVAAALSDRRRRRSGEWLWWILQCVGSAPESKALEWSSRLAGPQAVVTYPQPHPSVARCRPPLRAACHRCSLLCCAILRCTVLCYRAREPAGDTTAWRARCDRPPDPSHAGPAPSLSLG